MLYLTITRNLRQDSIRIIFWLSFQPGCRNQLYLRLSGTSSSWNTQYGHNLRLKTQKTTFLTIRCKIAMLACRFLEEVEKSTSTNPTSSRSLFILISRLNKLSVECLVLEAQLSLLNVCLSKTSITRATRSSSKSFVIIEVARVRSEITNSSFIELLATNTASRVSSIKMSPNFVKSRRKVAMQEKCLKRTFYSTFPCNSRT